MENKQLDAILKLHGIERNFGEHGQSAYSLQLHYAKANISIDMESLKHQATTYGLHYIKKPLQEQQNGLCLQSLRAKVNL